MLVNISDKLASHIMWLANEYDRYLIIGNNDFNDLGSKALDIVSNLSDIIKIE